MIPLAAINQLAAVYRGRGRNEAYLEFAQEHFLDWLRLEGLFEDDAVVFKGGTAIRKFVLGSEGRFSTDLDFRRLRFRPAGASATRPSVAPNARPRPTAPPGGEGPPPCRRPATTRPLRPASQPTRDHS